MKCQPEKLFVNEQNHTLCYLAFAFWQGSWIGLCNFIFAKQSKLAKLAKPLMFDARKSF